MTPLNLLAKLVYSCPHRGVVLRALLPLFLTVAILLPGAPVMAQEGGARLEPIEGVYFGVSLR